MDSDDYVETSDPEELEAAWFAARSSSRQRSIVPETVHDIISPRKRRKLTHEDGSSRHSTPSARAPAPSHPLIPEESNREVFETGQYDAVAAEQSQSQDELDVISQRPNSFSPERRIHVLSDRIDDPVYEVLGGGETIEPSLFTPPQTPEAEERVPSQQSSRLSSPVFSPILRNRFSSLPPSSPSRSQVAAQSSQRARSHSPIPSPSRDQQVAVNPGSPEPPIPEQSSDPNNDHEVAANLARSRYSFRSRKPQQQRPYAYDLQLYKGQLQNIPEAIVAAPRHHDRGEGHHHRNGHSHENETQDGDFIVPDDKSDEEAPQPRRSVAHEGGHKRVDIILPESMQMSDDDDDDLPDLGWSLDGVVAREKDGRSKLERRRKRFPLRKSREEGLQALVSRSSNEPERRQIRVTQDGPSHPSQRDNAREQPEDADLEIRPTSQATSSTVDVEVPIAGDADDFGLLYSDDLPQPYSPSPPADRSAGPEELSSDEETKLASGSDPEVRHVFESMDSKKRRALSRMMPAFMVSRLIKGQPDTKQTRKPTVTAPNDESEDENSGDLAPGKSKRLRKGNAHSIPVEIRGDTESSDSTDTSDQDRSGQSDSDVSDVSGDDKAQEEAIEAGWLDHDSSRRYAAPLSKRNEDLIDRMLTRTRTSKPRVRAARDSGPVGTKRPKNPSLDIVIPAPTRQKTGKQTRLPFRPQQSSDTAPYGEVYDLTRSEPPSPTEADPAPVLNAQKKLSKRERKRQLLLKQTYIVPSDGKLITNGRKKRLRIDMNDDAIHEALAPLGSAGVRPRIQTTNNKQIGSGTNIQRRRVPTRRNSEGPLRQTVLTEFEEDNNSVDGFEHHDAGPFSSQPLPHIRDDGWRRSGKATWHFRIKPLTIGLVFGPNTYVGKQLLRELLSYIADEGPPTQPTSLLKLDVALSPGMTAIDYAQSLDKVADVLCKRLSQEQAAPAQDQQEFKEYELLMYSSSRYLSWLLAQTPSDERKVIYDAVDNCTGRITLIAQSRLDSASAEAGQAAFEPLSILWFAIELSIREFGFASRTGYDVKIAAWKEPVLLLMRFLMSFGFKDVLSSITPTSHSLDGSSDSITIAGLWVCLIHLLPKMSETLKLEKSSSNYFSSLILEVVQERRHILPSDLEYSEYIWETISNLCALSQFSTNGISGSKATLPPCWNVVVAALSAVRLTHEPSVDQARARSTLRARDSYVHSVVSRCFMLCTRWNWSLADAHVMIDKLISVFKSRKYSDLLGEKPDYPTFLRHFNLRLLKNIRDADSTFCIILKVIAMAVVEDEGSEDNAQRVSSKLRRLLSLFMPNGKVPFTKESPPTSHELSMLYNRYSSIIIAIYLEHSAAAIKGRVEQARRYVDFPNLDWESKKVCIRAAMFITILLQHLKLPLDEPLKWLEDMTNVLLTEYREVASQPKVSNERPILNRVADQGKIQVVLCLQLLLGSIRYIIVTPSMDPEVPVTPSYPDVGLLSGPWIKHIFATKALTSIVSTGLQIQKLVQAFLDARARVVQPPRLPAVVDEESQESQDYFAEYEDVFDYNDPDLQAILDSGNAMNPSPNNNRQSDAVVAEIMDTDITHAIYRLVIQHFQDPSNSSITENTADEFHRNTDSWVDCWVGCAAVVVQNERRVWSYYLEMGSQSWTSISDSSLRRRVGLRFMHRLLQLDPPAYRSNQDAFLKVLMESLVTFKVTLEGEYTALLFSIDGLRHSILRDMPVERSDTSGEIQFRTTRFSELRVEIIAAIFSNLDDIIAQAPEGKVQSHYDIQTWIGFVFHLFSTMRDVYESLTGDDARTLYASICNRVFGKFMAHPRLRSQPRFASVLTWATTHLGLLTT